MKKCTSCKRTKDEHDFSVLKNTKGEKLKSICITCEERNRLYIQNHMEISLYKHAKERAKDKNIEFTIDINDIIDLIKATPICPIRHVPFEKGKGVVCANSMTLDRIDSSKGYIKDNIQLLSFKANTIKNNLSLQELEEFVNNWKQFEQSKIKQNQENNG